MKPNSNNDILHACDIADWEQVVFNGGPPCFHCEGESFCLRAERWAGHGSIHVFTSLRKLLESFIQLHPAEPTKPAGSSQPDTKGR